MAEEKVINVVDIGTNPHEQHFDVLGTPIPIARPRMMMRNGFTHAYLPKTSREWENNVKDTVANAIVKGDLRRIGSEIPLKVTIRLFIPTPKSVPKAERYLMQIGSLFPPKGDVDNYAKGIMDGMVQAQLIADDRQIVWLDIMKEYSPIPHAFVSVMELAGIMHTTHKEAPNG